MNGIDSIKRMTKALNVFRALYADIPTTTVDVFLQVAIRPGISSKELLDRVGASQSAISRHLAMLGDYSWRGNEGLGLVDLIEDPTNRRTKVAFLKPKGQALAAKLVAILDPDGDSPEGYETADEYVKRVRGGAR